MISPPLQETAPSPGNRESDAGSPRGKPVDHRPDAERARNNWRVMLEDTVRLGKGEIISVRLQHALQAPNGRIIPISEAELNLWFRTFYRLVNNKRGEAIAIVSDTSNHGIWGGSAVGDIHLQRGDWRIIRADDSVTRITQQHTQPIGALGFSVEGGRVVAGYPKTKEEKENPSTVEKFGDSDDAGVHAEKPIPLEGPNFDV